MKISVGDRVMFSRKFCQSIGAYTGFHPFAIGTVTAIDGKLVTINWDGEDRPGKALASNLVKKDRIHLEAN